MPSWRINDSRSHWNEPSLDFLLADKDLNLVVVELKREVLGVVPAWRVLSQVTHRRLLVVDTETKDLIERAWRSCWSGQHGRLLKAKEGRCRKRTRCSSTYPPARPFNGHSPSGSRSALRPALGGNPKGLQRVRSEHPARAIGDDGKREVRT